MAVDSGYERTKKKRKKKPKRKLLAGEQVEVLYSDEGLRGSWHTGIVINCGERIRLVEYKNLLSEDNCSRLKETIPVSAAIDGLSGKLPKYHRGHIRPLPPHCEIHESEMKYGLCVDAFVDDAWWEGVVFDQAEGSKERLIFFPDQGDQQMVHVDHLRLTQEWEEISGHWKPRGKWLLLEVLQTFEQEEELLVSVREIWFDLRTTTAFLDKIGVWTFGPHCTWYALVSELIHELRTVVHGVVPSKQLIGFSSCSGSIGIPMEDFSSQDGLDSLKDDDRRDPNLVAPTNYFLSPLYDHTVSDSSSHERHGNKLSAYLATKNINTECLEGKDSYVFPIQKPKNDYSTLENSISLVENCSSIIRASGTFKSTGYQEDTKCSLPDDQLSRKDCIGEATENRVAGRENMQDGESWKPLCIDPVYYPEAVKIYGGELLRQFMVNEKVCNVRQKAMQHLLAFGWKIETRRANGHLRTHFESPEGKLYHSLRKACREFLQRREKEKRKHGRKNYAEAGCLRTDYSDSHSAPLQKKCVLKKSKIQQGDSVLDIRLFRSIDAKSNKMHTGKSVSLSKMIDSGIIEEVSSSIFEERCNSTNHATSRMEDINDSEMVSPVHDNLEPGSFPEAVHEYKTYMDLSRSKRKHIFSSDLSITRLKARKHLKFMGWKFWIKGQHRKELFITSPTGKPFRSLYMACDEYLREESFKNCRARASQKKLGRRSATLSKISEFTEREVDTFCMEEHKKSKRRKLMPHFTPFSFVTSGDSQLKHPSRQSFVCEKAKRKKGCQSQLRKGQELGRSFSSHGVAKSSKRSQQDMLQTPSQRVPRTVLSLLIDNDMILPRQKVCYIRKRDGKVLMEGSITRDGIKCKCCKMVYTLSNFEAHAGSTYRRPAASIFLPDGRSLLECQMQMIHRRKPKDFRRLRLKGDGSQYKSDSVCSVCHDGGSLVLCDHCPSSFHLTCVGMENVPKGKWFCPSCRCGICGRSEFSSETEQFTEKSVLYCDQCEREYHVGCMNKRENRSLSSCPVGNWFCSKICSKIFLRLRQLVGISRPTAVDGLSCTILRSSRENGVDDLQFDAETITEHDSKLCVALDVLHECFVSIIEPRTQTDFVADLLFNKESELRRLNFYGFYTMLLEKGDELVSVATFRVYGDKVAEMPLVGTRVKYRRQGMCRLIINELEQLLSDLGVETLLLPAVPQLLQTWTSSFGFSKMTRPERLSLLDYTILYFQETTTCWKSLRKDLTTPRKPKGDSEELMVISSRPPHREESELHNDVEAVEPVEPIDALPPVDADLADEMQNEAENSPVSTRINPTDQMELESGVKGVVNVAQHNGNNSKATQDMSPVLALETPSLTSKFLRGYYERISKDSSMGKPYIKNIYDGAASTFKYFYKRRMSSNN